jgi:hypothetical protein
MYIILCIYILCIYIHDYNIYIYSYIHVCMILLYDYVDITTKWQEMLLRPTIMCCQLVVPASPWHRYLRGMDSEHRLLVFALVSRISTRLHVKARSLNQQVVASSYGEVTPASLLGREASFGKSLEAETPRASMLGLAPRPEPRRPQRRFERPRQWRSWNALVFVCFLVSYCRSYRLGFNQQIWGLHQQWLGI